MKIFVGKVDLGINFTKNIAAYLKNGGSLLRKYPQGFHGINPEITDPLTGKTFELPRFCSVEMQQARQMNRIALHQIKTPVTSSFPNAAAEDLKRLTSSAIEESYSRVRWTNPKDGKVYNLLKQGETDNGNVLIRILDKDGAFVKESLIKPKKIAIIDIFGFKQFEGNAYPEIIPARYAGELSHGEIVRIFVMRNNPFAKYTYIDVSKGSTLSGRLPNNLYEVANSSGLLNEKYDFLSVSLAREFNMYKEKSPIDQFMLLQNCTQQNREFEQFLNASTLNNTRVIVSSGNGGKNSLATTLLQGNVEGVGSLSPKGTISEFSASRNSYYTQHYELGEFKRQNIYNADGQIIGVNITGLSGTDIKVKYLRKLNDDEIKKASELRNRYNILEKKDEACEIYSDEYLKIQDEITSVKKELDNLTKGTIEANISDYDLSSVPKSYEGTSFSTPIRTAKLALNDMMEGIL